ncbi:MAG: AAA family ATPase [Clostridium sp.]|nr:AAA family ATPase [Clostridium sp.]
MEGQEHRSLESIMTEKNDTELYAEEKRLEGVISLLNREIINYVGERKEIAQYIIESRKKEIEEKEDDEDKVIDYFDHEKFVKEENYKNIDRKLKELAILEKSPYFGRIDFDDVDLGEQKIYIGRFGVTLNGSYEPLIVDWRAPVSSLFYNSKIGKNSYEAPNGKVNVDVTKKRQYIIKKKKLVGLFDSDVNVQDDILQLVLSKNAGEKLKDIVMSIQEEQDNIIRQPRNKLVIVNGTAGSGKTTIALHRVAYLLYNNRETLENKVLILGPNPIFMEYISSVLPSLGEVGVNQKTYVDFATELLGIRRKNVMKSSVYMEKILSRDSKFIEEVKYKNSDDFLLKLDGILNEVKNNYDFKDVVYNDKVIVEKSEISKMNDYYYKDMPIFRRTNKLRRIIFSKLEDERDNRVRVIQNEYRMEIDSLSNEELNTKANELNYIRKNKIRNVIKELMEVKKSLTWLDNSNIIDIYKKINSSDIYTVDDLTALLYLSIKLEGITLEREIKHVVIDEAQDYSSLAFKVIGQITEAIGMTVVGDSNQRLIPIEGKCPFEKIENIIDIKEKQHFNLTKSYRSTREIMDYADKFLKETKLVPLVRSGEKVGEFKASSDEEIVKKVQSIIEDYKNKQYDSIAVIFRDLKDTEKYGKLLNKNGYVSIISNEDMAYVGGTVAIPSYLAKGLEFDGVIVVNKGYLENEDKYMYVMATRALHELSVINKI